MTGSLTLWGAGQIINSFIGRDAAAPESFYLALIRSTPPTPYLSGAELDEPVVDDYSRVEIANDLSNWVGDIQPQLMLTSQNIRFPTAIADWGVMGYWALCDSPHEGSNYFVGSLEAPLAILAGDTALIGAGDLSVALGPFFTDG